MISQETYMINTVTTRSDVESALSQSHAVPFSKSTTDIHDRIRTNFLRLSASYLGANMSSSQVESIVNGHTAIHLN